MTTPLELDDQELAKLFDIELDDSEVHTVGSALNVLLWALERREDMRPLYNALARLKNVAEPFAGFPAGALLRGFRVLGERVNAPKKAKKLGVMAKLLAERVHAEATDDQVLGLWGVVIVVAKHQARLTRQREWSATASAWTEGLRALEAALGSRQ